MIETLIPYVTTHFLEVLIILLMGMLFFKEQLTKVLYFRFGVDTRKTNERRDQNGNSIVPEVQRLSSYYNHDLTQKLDLLIDNSREVKQLLEEFEKFGIKIRKE